MAADLLVGGPGEREDLGVGEAAWRASGAGRETERLEDEELRHDGPVPGAVESLAWPDREQVGAGGDGAGDGGGEFVVVAVAGCGEDDAVGGCRLESAPAGPGAAAPAGGQRAGLY